MLAFETSGAGMAQNDDGWQVFDAELPILTHEYSFGPGTANALAVGIDGAAHEGALDTGAAMQLYWFATADDGHYQSNLCRSWTDALDNFDYSERPIDPSDPRTAIAAIEPLRFKLDDCAAYIAGPQPFVEAARAHLRQGGLEPAHIHCETIA